MNMTFREMRWQRKAGTGAAVNQLELRKHELEFRAGYSQAQSRVSDRQITSSAEARAGSGV